MYSIEEIKTILNNCIDSNEVLRVSNILTIYRKQFSLNNLMTIRHLIHHRYMSI